MLLWNLQGSPNDYMMVIGFVNLLEEHLLRGLVESQILLLLELSLLNIPGAFKGTAWVIGMVGMKWETADQFSVVPGGTRLADAAASIYVW